MAVGIKIIETVQHRFQTKVFIILSHALFISHLEYSALCLFQISSTLLLPLEKQMNWI